MVWPDAEADSRVVPHGFPERPTLGKRYLMLVCVDPSGEQQGLEDPDAWVEEMDGRGVRLFGQVLRPPADATFVRTRGGRVLVTDGPFTEAKEWIAGLDFIEVSGFEEAVEVAAGHPMARAGQIVLSPRLAERETSELGKRSEPSVGVAH